MANTDRSGVYGLGNVTRHWVDALRRGLIDDDLLPVDMVPATAVIPLARGTVPAVSAKDNLPRARGGWQVHVHGETPGGAPYDFSFVAGSESAIQAEFMVRLCSAIPESFSVKASKRLSDVELRNLGLLDCDVRPVEAIALSLPIPSNNSTEAERLPVV